ncbi:unnamed protein product [Moneuplotes crassus]|uniref:Uncharacterized protein n=1 Tax=Euplotes crassus TaxID=5936 RepID=A0AAD2D6Y2_EUPCR|nr:unnamed protein product [Moneuplotes crassus]
MILSNDQFSHFVVAGLSLEHIKLHYCLVNKGQLKCKLKGRSSLIKITITFEDDSNIIRKYP